ncbi:MAG: MATE family efflux transporter [Coriobacteriia bacterium]|nr:MATE family efflux transporter [Coriobacteriia bacterium]
MKKVSFSGHKFYRLFAAGTISLLVVILAESIDNIVAGNMINEQAISAVGIVSSIYTLICFVSVLIGSGGAIIYQQLIGKFKKEHAKEVFCTSLIASMFLGVLLMFAISFFENDLLLFFGCSDELFEYARQYYSYYKIIALIYPVYILIYNMVYNDGDALCTAIADVVQLLSNIIFSVLFCFRFGLEGISFATCIALMLSTGICITHFFKKKNSVKIKFGMKFSYLLSSIRYSFSEASIYLCTSVLLIASNKFIIVIFGEYYLPVFNVAMFVISLMAVCQGIAKAVTPFLCIYYSENNIDGLKHIMKKGHLVSLITGIIMTVLFYCFADYIPLWYGVSSENLVFLSAVAVRSTSTFIICVAFVYLYSQYYLVIGKIQLAVMFMVLSSLVAPLLFLIVPAITLSKDAVWYLFGGHILFAFIIAIIVIFVVYGRKNFPLLLKDNKTISRNFNLLLNKESLMQTQKDIIVFLEDQNVKKKTIDKIALYVEEIGLSVLDKNDKPVIMEYSLIFEDKNILLIERDNGCLFDITDQDMQSVSLNTFVVSSLMSKNSSNQYIKSTGFNRSVYKFEL